MIDEKKLIKDLQTYFLCNYIHKNDLAEVIAKQPKVGEWIPCSERLPEEPVFDEKGYLVQQDNVVEPYSAYWDGQKWTDSCGDDCGNIIAWQPLPQPYREKVE